MVANECAAEAGQLAVGTRSLRARIGADFELAAARRGNQLSAAVSSGRVSFWRLALRRRRLPTGAPSLGPASSLLRSSESAHDESWRSERRVSRRWAWQQPTNSTNQIIHLFLALLFHRTGAVLVVVDLRATKTRRAIKQKQGRKSGKSSLDDQQ